MVTNYSAIHFQYIITLEGRLSSTFFFKNGKSERKKDFKLFAKVATQFESYTDMKNDLSDYCLDFTQGST